MSLPRRNLLRALPASQRTVNIVAYEVLPATDAADAQAAYLRALTNAETADELPTAPKTSRPIFTDASGAFFTVHDSEDGPVTLPAEMRPPLRHDPAGQNAGGFINQNDAEAMRGDIAKLYNADRALYPAAVETSAKHPSLVAQATAGLLKSAMSEGLSALTTSLASDGNVLDNLKKFVPGGCMGGGSVGDIFSAANLAAGAGLVTGQIAGMAFGALNDALFGDIGDDSSTGAQLGAFAGQKAMGELESMATDELTSLIQGAIDPASVPPPTAEDAKSTSQKIKEFFAGVTSTATMPAARLGDTTAHGGKLVKGAAKTLFNGLPAARALDLQVCPLVEPGPVPHIGGPIREGNPTILLEAMLAARVGHMVICTGVGLQNPIAAGSGNILLGAQTAAVLPPPIPVELPSAAAEAGKGAAGAAAGAGGGKDDAKAKEEADAKAKQEAGAKAKEEEQAAKAKEEADAKAKEEADAKAKEEQAKPPTKDENGDEEFPDEFPMEAKAYGHEKSATEMSEDEYQKALQSAKSPQEAVALSMERRGNDFNGADNDIINARKAYEAAALKQLGKSPDQLRPSDVDKIHNANLVNADAFLEGAKRERDCDILTKPMFGIYDHFKESAYENAKQYDSEHGGATPNRYLKPTDANSKIPQTTPDMWNVNAAKAGENYAAKHGNSGNSAKGFLACVGAALPSF